MRFGGVDCRRYARAGESDGDDIRLSHAPSTVRAIGMRMTEISLLHILRDLFPRRERILAAGVFAMSVTAALFETLGVASILPFMALVLDPTALVRYAALHSMAASAGITTPHGAVIFVGILTVSIIALGNTAAALSVLVNEQFGARTKTRISSSLFAGYLRQPYRFHVQRDAPSLMKVVLNDVNAIVGSVVHPFLTAVSRGLVALGVVIVLFFHDPLVAVGVSIGLLVAYASVYRFVRSKQRMLGNDYSSSNLDRHRVMQEGLGGVKELQALGREEHAIMRFEDAARRASHAEAANQVIGQLPRHVLEALAFGGILLFTLALEIRSGAAGAQTIVPVLALYAFAGYRLLPALQHIFVSAVNMRFALPTLRALHADFVLVNTLRQDRASETERMLPLRSAKEIRLNSVTLAYTEGAKPAVFKIDLVIRPNEAIGLVGRTGAGKTTLVDIILGLYEPSSGSITIDGVPMSRSAIHAWRRQVGYVPQHVFLSNASIAENIAFGFASSQIDADAVRRAARLAQAEEFINGLPDGFETIVGERGVKLSGGQRQRIGIARALYHGPPVLVLDEATSALDGLTEDAFMAAIRSLRGERTIILIAHRIRTVEACDRIVMLDRGHVVADGSYQDLLQNSPHFCRLVGTDTARPLEAARGA
jgi:ATP-binding cassette, subfamily B, bacterial PglK